MKCQGTTNEGNPCDREASEGTNNCYQHIHGTWNRTTHLIANFFSVKRRFLFLFILFSVLLFCIQLQVSYNYAQIRDDLQKVPNIEVEISPFLYSAAFGEYLPLIVTNTGDYTFREVDIFIHSCEMPEDYDEYYQVPLLPSRAERIIPLGNKDVIQGFKKANCYPFAGKDRSYASFTFNPLKMKPGENVSAVSTGCGICFFDADISAKYIVKDMNVTFNKKIRSYLTFPVDLQLTVSN